MRKRKDFIQKQIQFPSKCQRKRIEPLLSDGELRVYVFQWSILVIIEFPFEDVFRTIYIIFVLQWNVCYLEMLCDNRIWNWRKKTKSVCIVFWVGKMGFLLHHRRQMVSNVCVCVSVDSKNEGEIEMATEEWDEKYPNEIGFNLLELSC